MKLIAGVDAGASHTEAAVADSELHSVVREVGPPGNTGIGRGEEASAVIAETVRMATRHLGRGQTIETLVVGAAGAGLQENRRTLRRALAATGIAERVDVTTDGQIALENAFPNRAGILLSAGTGSIAYGRDGKGGVWRVGGLGWRFGDEGSGYAIARDAIAAVFRAKEKRGPQTALAAVLTTRIGAMDEAALARWLQAVDKAAVASLAPDVISLAHAGDPVASAIIDRAVNDLVDHAVALVDRIERTGGTDVALNGGLLRLDSPLRQTLMRRLGQRLPAPVRFKTEVDPVLGALQLAAQSVERAG